MNKGFLTVVTAAVLFVAGFPFQSKAQETQIPLDAQNKITVITPEMEQELHLFPDVENFHSARLFSMNDTAYVLEIEYKIPAGVVRKREVMDRREMQAFRDRVTGRVQTIAPALSLNQEGRTNLITGISVLTAIFYAPTIIDLMELEDGSAVGLYFILAGGGYLIPYLATQNTEVTDGMATLGIHGGVRGFVDGFLIYWLATGIEDESDGKALAASALFASIGELIAGIHIADANDLTGGEASVLSTTGFFGLGIGMAAYGMSEPAKADRIGALAGIGGSVLGYIAGNAMAKDQYYTSGDGTMLTWSGILGAALPTAFATLTDSEDAPLYYGTLIAGSIAGLWIGHELVRGKDFSSTQATNTALVTTGGALMGAGIGYLAQGDDVDARAPLILGSAGAALAFGLMLDSYSDEARTAAEASGHASSWDLQISPLGMAAMLGGTGFGDYPVPVAGISYHW